jgi:hypothetical protein
MMVKIAVFAPIPSANASVASAVNPGVRRNNRSIYRTSVAKDYQNIDRLSCSPRVS